MIFVCYFYPYNHAFVSENVGMKCLLTEFCTIEFYTTLFSTTLSAYSSEGRGVLLVLGEWPRFLSTNPESPRSNCTLRNLLPKVVSEPLFHPLPQKTTMVQRLL